LAQIHTPFNNQNAWLQNAEELNRHQIFNASKLAAEKHLNLDGSFFLSTDPIVQRDRAVFCKEIANISNGKVLDSASDIINPAIQQRISLFKAQYYFQKKYWVKAIQAYEKAGIANLNNKELVASKFELAYCYFNNKQFSESKKLMLGIKDIESNYTTNAQYYYGLLAYNEGDYKTALLSFEKIETKKDYKEVVPYYIAEILYFDGQKQKALTKAKAAINGAKATYYHKELHLLAAQCLFDEKDFKNAIPYYELYYKNVDKIRKQDLFNLGFCYHQTEQWEKAIEPFKQLSAVQEPIGQNAMYLLGDCYLKTNDKIGAKNAFIICSEMKFNEQLIEPSLLISGKLAFEQGYAIIGSTQLKKIITDYPNSPLKSEASNILSEQLINSGSFAEAYQMIAQSSNANKELIQKVCYGYALVNIQNNNWAEAEKLLNESIENSVLTSYEAAAYFWKAEIDYKNSKFSSAINNGKQFLEKVQPENVKISPNATTQNALMTMGYSALNIQNFEQAREYFAQAQNKQSNTKDGFSEQLASDAILREADAAFLAKDYLKASELYTKSLSQKSIDGDYALFQKSNLLGLLGKSSEQAEILLQIIGQKNPESKYKYEAHYALGDLHLDANKFEDAINHFQKITELTAKHLVVKALMKTAFAYQEAEDEQKAISTYKNVISLYPNSDQRNGALDALKALYLITNQPNAFVKFLKDFNLEPSDKTGLDSLFYAAAETQYANNKFAKAIEGFRNYTTEYPQGIFKTKAAFYKAESHYQLNELDSSLIGYSYVLAQPWNDFTEPSALKASAIAMDQKKYIEAERYYSALRNNSIGINNLKIAYKGLMLLAKFQKNDELSSNLADTLLSFPDLDEISVQQAFLTKGNAALNKKEYSKASDFFEKIHSSKNVELSSEAKFKTAELLVLQNKLKEAEIATNIAIQQTTSSAYWNTKSYLLMADIFIAQKDYFNAKATLQSLIKNVKNEELKKEAQKKLDQVKLLEKSKSKLSEG
jgi:tetratricopeptide (TPR) repeat protein